MDFKGKEIDRVLLALKAEGKLIYADHLQEKYLSDWQVLKVEAIFKYLYENYSHRFEWANYNTSMNMGYGLEYSNKWDEDLEKGGFTEYWSHKEKFKLSLKELLGNTKSGVSTINAALSLVDRFF